MRRVLRDSVSSPRERELGWDGQALHLYTFTPSFSLFLYIADAVEGKEKAHTLSALCWGAAVVASSLVASSMYTCAQRWLYAEFILMNEIITFKPRFTALLICVLPTLHSCSLHFALVFPPGICRYPGWQGDTLPGWRPSASLEPIPSTDIGHICRQWRARPNAALIPRTLFNSQARGAKTHNHY